MAMGQIRQAGKGSVGKGFVAFSLFTGGALLGTAAMYFLDPKGGRRRRAVVKEKTFSLGRQAGKAGKRQARDLANRAEGLKARLKSLKGSQPVDDQTLVSRVRTELGRVAEHPKLIRVDAHEGEIFLNGSCAFGEKEEIQERIAGIHGVKSVRNDLQVTSDYSQESPQEYLH